MPAGLAGTEVSQPKGVVLGIVSLEDLLAASISDRTNIIQSLSQFIKGSHT